MIRVDSILHFLYAKLISISIIHGILHIFTLLPVFSVFLRDMFTPFWYYGCLKRIEHGHIATECWTATECGLRQPLSLGSGQWILCLFWKMSILIQIHDYRILQITPQFQGFHLSMDFGLLCHPGRLPSSRGRQDCRDSFFALHQDGMYCRNANVVMCLSSLNLSHIHAVHSNKHYTPNDVVRWWMHHHDHSRWL